MSHFYGTVAGSGDTEATRGGTKKSGILTHAASWDGAVWVSVEHVDGVDRFEVRQVQWRGHGCDELLAQGVVGQKAGRFSALSEDERIALGHALKTCIDNDLCGDGRHVEALEALDREING